MSEVFSARYISGCLTAITKTCDGVSRCLLFLAILTHLLAALNVIRDYPQIVIIARQKCMNFEILISNLLEEGILENNDAECYRSFKNKFLEATRELADNDNITLA